jgi:NAD(P)-dependent dehydrogenase (short-subunit alcohol dehydrogenase family)
LPTQASLELILSLAAPVRAQKENAHSHLLMGPYFLEGVVEPTEPSLKIVEVDLIGVLYTVNLALHYFRQQYDGSQEDDQAQILILQGSMAGYLGLPGAVQYAAAKYGLRGMMKTLRSTEWRHNIRVGYIAPW